MPQLADTTIYRWEYNFRASTVLGAVGAGGIGFELIAALRVLEYAQVSAILICILDLRDDRRWHGRRSAELFEIAKRESEAMAENPEIVVTNPVFPETRALLEESATVEVNEALEPWPYEASATDDAAMPSDCLRS